MAVLASASCTLACIRDVASTYRYYKLASSMAAVPDAPGMYPPNENEELFQRSGYLLNQRVGSGGLSAYVGSVVSGLIKVVPSETSPYTLRLIGVSESMLDNFISRLGYFNSSGTQVGSAYIRPFAQTVADTVMATKDGDDYILSIDRDALGNAYSFWGNTAYIRICIHVSSSSITDSDVAGIQVMRGSAKPTSEEWTEEEPGYTSGSTNTLYHVDCTVFTDGTYSYSTVSKSSSYEAAKEAYNKAVDAQNAVAGAEQDIETLYNEVTNAYTNAVSNAEQIVMEALTEYVKTGDLDAFREEISTQFTQTSESFSFEFSKLQEYISTVDGDMRSQHEETLKYIRFIGGNIYLGEEGNPLILTIRNDRISFTQNGVEVAYLSNAKMFVDDIVVNKSATLAGVKITRRKNGSIDINII